MWFVLEWTDSKIIKNSNPFINYFIYFYTTPIYKIGESEQLFVLIKN